MYTEGHSAVMRGQALSLRDVTMRNVQMPDLPLAKAE